MAVPERQHGKFGRALEIFGVAHLAHTIAQTEFVRTLLWPLMLTMLTGGAGVLGGIPAMYIFVACAVTFGGLATGILRISEFRERQTPLNKVIVVGVQAPCALAPAPLLLPMLRGNRRQRRAQQAGVPPPPPPPMTLSGGEVVPGINRTIEGMQLAVVLRNAATFPISCILNSADTEIATFKPPRSAFPKGASVISAGSTFSIPDERIDMDNISAGRLAGKLNMHIKYGLPGKEVYDLYLVCDVDILMEEYGLIKQIVAMWHN